MRTGSVPKPRHNSFVKPALRLTVFLSIAALLAVSLYTASTAGAYHGGGVGAGASPVSPVKTASGSSQRAVALWAAMVPQAASPSIATFLGAGCTTPQSDFVLGQTVCAHVTGGTALPRRLQFVDPSGFVRQTTNITSDPQDITFDIPATQTSTVGNNQVDNRGTWRVNMVSSRGTLVTRTTFVVTDPARAEADVSVSKSVTEANATVTAGSTSTFQIEVRNNGPNDAKDVILTDVVPANTTFNAMVQRSGPTFTCTVPATNGTGTITCTISTLAAGASADFDFAYGVNPAAPVGTTITNTATVSSDTSIATGAEDPESGNNSATASSTVVASGGGSPTCTLTCPLDVNVQSNTTDPNNPNQPGAVVHYDAPTTEGTCGTITFSHCNDCFFPQGVTVVSVSETTGESCQFNVTVSATSNAPTISCPSNKEVDANGACSVVVNVGTATATGGENVTIFATRSDGKPMYNCDSNGQNCVRQSPDYPFGGGVTTITWTATSHNAAGEETGNSSCTQTITVNNATEDTTAPVITCPANITRSNDSGQCSAAINVGTATATDNCDSNPTVEGTRSDGQALSDPYPKGTTTIHWTATDSSGNSSSCDQTVTVNDTEAPAISCPANITRSTDSGTCAANIDPGTATATDNCGAASVSGTRSDAQPLNAPYPKGTTTIHWTATDGSGNTASCDQTVTVNDTEAPAITCPANITTGTEPGTCSAHVVTGTATATDNCGTATVSGTRSDGRPLTDTYPRGTTTITWTATDGSGNQSSCAQTVTVVDDQAPTITFNGQTPSMWPPNHSYHTFTASNFISSVSDNCDSVSVNDVYITKVTSDETENAAGSGSTLNDIVIAANCKSVQLRAERINSGNGRVYTIYFKLVDSSGNVTTGTAKVYSPKNQGETPGDDGPHYTVTSSCP
ncbi:MAG: hypothetical protein QOH70_827 [Blastocatellia bacterium]|nr:hypothetical protein [Blastocatellia bacterium]